MDKHKDNGILLVPGDVLKCEKKRIMSKFPL